MKCYHLTFVDRCIRGFAEFLGIHVIASRSSRETPQNMNSIKNKSIPNREGSGKDGSEHES